MGSHALTAAMVLARFALASLLFAAPVAIASPSVPPLYQKIALYHGIPPSLFYAIALGESNSALSDRTYRPWPWTLNVAGTPMRFDTREAAHAELLKQLQSGRRNVDVGLVQVNWRWHGQRFASPWDALDPVTNLVTGAQIINELRRNCPHCDWWTLVGRYHNPTKPHLAAAYTARIRKHWNRL